MVDSCRKLRAVLVAELEDLGEDIRLVEGRMKEGHSANEISDYVYRENDAVLRRELAGLKTLIVFIDGIDVSLYKSVADLVTFLEARIPEVLREHEDPEAIHGFFTRKLRKAERYVARDD